MSSELVPWGRFTHDPRQDQNGLLRASDQDRDVVTEVLAEGYADGRLSLEEFDQRTGDVAQAKTLGELSPILADLVPAVPAAPNNDLALATPEELDAAALRKFQSSRRAALVGMLIPSLITFVIWFATGFGDGGWQANFPWFLFVVLGTGINLVRMAVQKQDIIDEERAKLEKKQRKALEPGPPSPDEDDAEN